MLTFSIFIQWITSVLADRRSPAFSLDYQVDNAMHKPFVIAYINNIYKQINFKNISKKKKKKNLLTKQIKIRFTDNYTLIRNLI